MKQIGNLMVQRVQQGMSLKEASATITANLTKLSKELRDQKQDFINQIAEKTNDLRRASEQGDRSENAEFTEALEKLQQLQAALRDIDTRLESMDVDTEADYKPIGMIVKYSTFRIRDNEGVEYVFKLYPDNVSDLEKNIMAKNSRIAQALWLKGVGDTVSVMHDGANIINTYTVIDLY